MHSMAAFSIQPKVLHSQLVEHSAAVVVNSVPVINPGGPWDQYTLDPQGIWIIGNPCQQGLSETLSPPLNMCHSTA
jgi:hypothetical protein